MLSQFLKEKIPAAKDPLGEEHLVCKSPTVSIPTEDKDEFIRLFAEFFSQSDHDENTAPTAFSRLPLAKRINTLSIQYLSQERRSGNIKPRIEDRGIEGNVFQLALALNNGDERTRFNTFLHEKAPELCKKYAVIQAGSTTLEIGIKGIDKASPMRYLATKHYRNELYCLQSWHRTAATRDIRIHDRSRF